jgi:hypothetical protein
MAEGTALAESAVRERLTFGPIRAPCALRLPGEVAAKVLPETLKPPDHVHLAVRKMFEKTVAHKPGYIVPVIVTFVGNFFL